MTFANPFWNWFWHIFGVVCICLICLPSRYLQRVTERYAVHRPLSVEQVSRAILTSSGEPPALPASAQTTADPAWLSQAIDAFNQSNFLYRNRKPPKLEGPVLHLVVGHPPITYRLYPAGPYVAVERTRKGRAVCYTVQSKPLLALLWSVGNGDSDGV
ncbi:MAG: YfmQ family protein [Alicyclobacillus sp.]|nr:YfmQ family protein [Alicyclobacillus sp.]